MARILAYYTAQMKLLALVCLGGTAPRPESNSDSSHCCDAAGKCVDGVDEVGKVFPKDVVFRLMSDPKVTIDP